MAYYDEASMIAARAGRWADQPVAPHIKDDTRSDRSWRSAETFKPAVQPVPLDPGVGYGSLV